MRTERIFHFLVRTFFAYWKGYVFYTHWHLGKIALLPVISTLPLHHQKNNNGVPEATINP